MTDLCFTPPRNKASSVRFSDKRYEKAKEESRKKAVDRDTVIALVNEYLESKNLITTENPVVENPTEFDYKKYKENYGLADKRDIVWIKFTKDDYVGVVATSNDINFSYPTCECDYSKIKDKKWAYHTSGILIHKLGKEWEESFVLVFPLKSKVNEKIKRGELEKEIGNHLIEKGVPILDYYSHMY
ncbi:MAG: hypothetical protein Q3988_05360 [Gemella sp.]|nr:hypothetical protein [Gemella sp.]